ncbi:MAG TPA: DUF2796 domain-containing protein [Gammaproteobacteria bacterium]|nr:DUF2796 domain-containing protein [Gammaproteobacteria bacterium]
MRFRYLLAPLLFALTPHSFAAHDHEHQHSLGAHVHGVASLNIALEDQQLTMQLESPAMNIVGFEYTPSSAKDQQAVVDAERTLKNEQLLFSLTSAAQCALSSLTIENDLTEQHAEHDHSADEEHQHSDINVSYLFKCATPTKLRSIDFTGFFKAFPLTEKINVQLISAEAQQGTELTANNPLLSW